MVNFFNKFSIIYKIYKNVYLKHVSNKIKPYVNTEINYEAECFTRNEDDTKDILFKASVIKEFQCRRQATNIHQRLYLVITTKPGHCYHFKYYAVVSTRERVHMHTRKQRYWPSHHLSTQQPPRNALCERAVADTPPHHHYFSTCTNSSCCTQKQSTHPHIRGKNLTRAHSLIISYFLYWQLISDEFIIIINKYSYKILCNIVELYSYPRLYIFYRTYMNEFYSYKSDKIFYNWELHCRRSYVSVFTWYMAAFSLMKTFFYFILFVI